MGTMRSIAAGVAAVLALAGCSDSTGSSTGAASGSLSFGYTGVRSGSYSASGTLHLVTDSTFTKQQFAAGIHIFTGVDAVGLLAYSPVTGSTGHEVLMVFPYSTTSQTLDLSGAGCTTTTALCPFASIVFDSNPDLSVDGSQEFDFVSGTLQVSGVSNGRVQGTFSGTASTVGGDSVITVTNGTFDVPVLEESQFQASRSGGTPKFLAGRVWASRRIFL